MLYNDKLQLSLFNSLTLRFVRIMSEASKLKKDILAACFEMVDLRIETNTAILSGLTESMHGQTKSSAGDKFETSRAMMQADQDRYKGIIIKTKELKQKLSVLSLEPSDIIREGSLVRTSGINYFIAVGLGKIEVPELVYVISKDAPIGQKLIGKREGSIIHFNQNKFTILSVE